MESPNNKDELRKSCKHLLVDLGLDKPGTMEILKDRLSEKMSCPVNKRSLNMALTGYRTTSFYQEMLMQLHDLLLNWPPEAA
jgi:hypothetical protein